MESKGFEKYSTPALLTTYRNLMGGIDRVAAILDVTDEHQRVPVERCDVPHKEGETCEHVVHVGCCKFSEPPTNTKGGVPPAQFGVVGLWMLQSVATELLRREVPLPTTKETP